MDNKEKLARLLLADANEAGDRALEDYRSTASNGEKGGLQGCLLRAMREQNQEEKIRTRISNLPADSQERADGIQLLTWIDRLRAATPTPPAPPVAEAGREEQIRERLAAATPGPWVYTKDSMDDWGCIRTAYPSSLSDVGWLVGSARAGGKWYDANEHRAAKTDPYAHNAELIAHAPDDIAYLLARLTDARATAESSFQVAAGLQEELAQVRATAEGYKAVATKAVQSCMASIATIQQVRAVIDAEGAGVEAYMGLTDALLESLQEWSAPTPDKPGEGPQS